MNTEQILGTDAAAYESSSTNNVGNKPYKGDALAEDAKNSVNEESTDSLEELRVKREEKRTSILEQVLTGNLTMNDRKDLNPKAKLSSKWWCAPCNSYFK